MALYHQLSPMTFANLISFIQIHVHARQAWNDYTKHLLKRIWWGSFSLKVMSVQNYALFSLWYKFFIIFFFNFLSFSKLHILLLINATLYKPNFANISSHSYICNWVTKEQFVPPRPQISVEFDEIFPTGFHMILIYRNGVILIKLKNGYWWRHRKFKN